MPELGESFLLALPESFLIFYSFIGKIEPNTLPESRVLSDKAREAIVILILGVYKCPVV
jgi:hypothetical protein